MTVSEMKPPNLPTRAPRKKSLEILNAMCALSPFLTTKTKANTRGSASILSATFVAKYAPENAASWLMLENTRETNRMSVKFVEKATA